MIESLLSVPAHNPLTWAGLVLSAVSIVGIVVACIWQYLQERGEG